MYSGKHTGDLFPASSGRTLIDGELRGGSSAHADPRPTSGSGNGEGAS